MDEGIACHFGASIIFPTHSAYIVNAVHVAIKGSDNDSAISKLSDGGTDACTVREFDVVTKKFVEGPDAFALPPGKNNFCWVSLFYSRPVWAM